MRKDSTLGELPTLAPVVKPSNTETSFSRPPSGFTQVVLDTRNSSRALCMSVSRQCSTCQRFILPLDLTCNTMYTCVPGWRQDYTTISRAKTGAQVQ